MSKRTNRARLRRHILKSHRVTRVKRKSVSNPASPIRMTKLMPIDSPYDDLKTDRMRLIEGRLGIAIEVLLLSSSNKAEVGRLIGVGRATVLKWKRRLEL